MSEKQWFAFDVTTTPDNREAIEYGLMEAGALGTETVDSESDVCVTGYFENPIDENKVRRALVDAWRLYNQVPSEIDRVNFKVRAVADRDWLAEWKKSWQPVQVGRFIVAPPWLVSVPGDVATGSSDPSGANHPLATARGTDTLMFRKGVKPRSKLTFLLIRQRHSIHRSALYFNIFGRRFDAISFQRQPILPWIRRQTKNKFSGFAGDS